MLDKTRTNCHTNSAFFLSGYDRGIYCAGRSSPTPPLLRLTVFPDEKVCGGRGGGGGGEAPPPAKNIWVLSPKKMHFQDLLLRFYVIIIFIFFPLILFIFICSGASIHALCSSCLLFLFQRPFHPTIVFCILYIPGVWWFIKTAKERWRKKK